MFSQKLLSDSVNAADVNGLHIPLKMSLCHIIPVMSATFLSHNYMRRCAFVLHLTQIKSVSWKNHPLLGLKFQVKKSLPNPRFPTLTNFRLPNHYQILGFQPYQISGYDIITKS